jgi:TrmH family RNA methyltransferase
VEEVLVAPGADRALVERARAAGAEILPLEAGVIERVADAATPQPLISITALIDVALDSLRDSTFLVVCAEISDPGNLGTVLRSARAAGADGVVCTANSVDVHSPKVVRSSAGSMFHIPIVVGGNPVEVLEKLGSWGVMRLGAAVAGGTDPAATDLASPVALVVGNEAHGLPPAAAASLDATVTIPMAPGVESLNVAMATTVLCFEVARQRREAARA